MWPKVVESGSDQRQGIKRNCPWAGVQNDAPLRYEIRIAGLPQQNDQPGKDDGSAERDADLPEQPLPVDFHICAGGDFHVRMLSRPCADKSLSFWRVSGNFERFVQLLAMRWMRACRADGACVVRRMARTTDRASFARTFVATVEGS